MRKRLRKKRHLKEFREYGASLVVNIHDGTDFDEFLDDFILEAVEANGLAFGGGGSVALLEGYLELGCQSEYKVNLSTVDAWLAADSRVQRFKFGTPEDAWYPSR